MQRLLLMLVILAFSTSGNANRLRHIANKITPPIASKFFQHAAIFSTAALFSLSIPHATLAEDIASSSKPAEQVQQVQQSNSKATKRFKSAVSEGDAAWLQKVLTEEEGIDINAKLFKGHTALQASIDYGQMWGNPEEIEIIELLLAHGADPFIKDQHGWDIFEGIDKYGYDGHEPFAALAVLVKHVHGINGSDGEGTPLQYAMRFADYRGQIWLARKLVAEGADVRVIKDMHSRDYHTIGYETLEDAAILVTNGTDFMTLVHEAGGIERVVRHVGEYLLKRAVAYGNLAVAKVMVEHGVNPTVALHEAAVIVGRGGSVVPVVYDPASSVLEYLLAQGADPNKDIRDGFSPLHTAASDGNYKGLEALLATNNELVNVVDKNGWTVLHHAVAKTTGGFYAVKKFAMVNMLLANGAHVNIKDNNGFTPYDYVLKSFSPQRHTIEESDKIVGAATAALLLKSIKGEKDEQGRTAHYWAEASNLTLIKELVKEEKAYLQGAGLHGYLVTLNGQIKEWNGWSW